MGVFTVNLNKIAGFVDGARIYVLLYVLATKELISTKADIANNKSQEKKRRGIFFHSQMKIYRRREIAWVLDKRTQFWFERQ